MTVDFFRIERDGTKTLVASPRNPGYQYAQGGHKYWVPIKSPGVVRYNVLDRIYTILPKGATYIDVFGGSGKFAAYLDRPGRRVYNDLNPWLVFALTHLRDLPAQRLDRIFAYRIKLPEEDFEVLREKIRNETPRTLGDLMDFMMFNVMACRGRIDGTYPKGSQPNGRGTWEKWLDFRHHIQGVEFWNRDALDVIRDASSRTVIFLDPPYPSKNSGYRSYVDLGALRDALRDTKAAWLAYVRDKALESIEGIDLDLEERVVRCNGIRRYHETLAVRGARRRRTK